MPWLFIAVTAAIWLLVKLSKAGYEQAVEIHLAPHGIPIEANVPSDTEFTFLVILKGRGFDLIAAKHRLQKIEGLPINTLLDKKDNSTWHISLEALSDFFQQSVPRSVRVAEVEPPALALRAKQTARKKVAVVAPLVLKTVPGFRVTKIDLLPDSISIVGDVSIVEKWNSVQTQAFSAVDLRDTLSTLLTLQNPYPAKVTIEPAQVKLTAQVELWTELQLRVPIAGMLPYGKTISPNVINITVNVPARLQNRVVADEFLFTLAVPTLGETDVFRPILLERKPDWAEVLDWQPKRAAVIETRQP